MRPDHSALLHARAALLVSALSLAAVPAAAQEERIGVAEEECVVTNRQSPVVLSAPFEDDTATLAVNYPLLVHGAYAFNSGLTVQVNIPEAAGAWVEVSGRRFRLLQFHTHHPVEHRPAETAEPGRVEVHLVHSDGHGEAVIATLVRVQGWSDPWAPLLGRLPVPGDTVPLNPLNLGAMFLLTDLNDEPLIRYDGSLTTPPYCQGVRWLVRQQAISWSSEQYQALLRVTPQLRRLPMPRHGRPVYRRP